MSEIDRAVLITHLEALSDSDDATALNAARESSRLVSESGLSWDDLLTPEDTADGEENDAPRIDLSGLPDDEAALVDMLLARDDLNDDTRDDLETFKQDIADGNLAQEDKQYLKALVARLGS